MDGLYNSLQNQEEETLEGKVKVYVNINFVSESEEEEPLKKRRRQVSD